MIAQGRSMITLNAMAYVRFPTFKKSTGPKSSADRRARHRSCWGEAVRREREEDWSLKYRDVDYAIIQGLGRQLWKWAVTVNGVALKGQAATRSEAIAAAERAIDRTLAPKKLKLVRPDQE